jgi:hypothetical protein
MQNHTTIFRFLYKVVEVIVLSIITVLVFPLIALVWLLDISEKLKQGNRKRLWIDKTRKEFYDNRNNPVIQG